jgi:hypothetical protein
VTTPPPAPRAAPTPGEACANCGAPLYGKYCYACGQPTTGLVRHFGSVMSDAADSIFNVDERLFRTLGPLYLQPGKLTLDYFAGRRARYVTPFRLVFFLAIIAFFAIQVTLRAGYTHTVEEITIGASPGKRPSVALVPQQKALPAPVAVDNGVFGNGNITINHKVLWNRDHKPLTVGWLPGAANDWLNDLIANAQEQMYAMNSGTGAARQDARRKFVRGMFSAAPTVLFVLLPFFALLLKIVYVFKRRLYMEHLIVAMHSHAFLMLSMLVLLALGLLSSWLAPHAHWARAPLVLLRTAAWIWIFVYLWRMQRRVYGQGWFMTTWKYCWIGFWYSILAGFGFTFAVLLSLTGA